MINLQQLDQLARSVGIDLWDGLTVPAECKKLDENILRSACFERCGLNIPIYPDPDTFRAAVTLWAKKNQYTFIHVDKIMAAEYSPIENVFEDKTTTRKFDGKTDTSNKTTGETSETKDTLTSDVLSNDTTTVSHGKTTTLAHGKTTTLAHGKTTTLEHGKTTTESGTDHNDTTNTKSAYDVNTYSPDNKSENEIRYGHTSTEGGADTSRDGGSDITTAGGSDTSTEGGTDTTQHNYTRTGTEDTDTVGKTKTDSTGKELKDDLEKITESRHGNVGIISNNKLQIEEYNMLAQFNPYNFLAGLFENELTLYIY